MSGATVATMSTAELIGVGLSAAGTAASIGGQIAGSGEQSNAASNANASQMQMYQQMRNDLTPYMQTGMAANTQLNKLTGIADGQNPLTSELLKPITMDQATLEQTPGYQFNRTQGLKAVQNAAAARGLGSSGAALKGAADFATGLADNTYQNQFQNALANQTNQYNRLLGLTQLGQSSAAGVGASGIQTGEGIASNTIGGGNARAAGLVGVGNAVNNAYGNYQSNKLLGSMGNFYSGAGNAGVNQAAYNLNNNGYGNAAYSMIENSSGY